MSLLYWEKQEKNQITYSIDMIRLKLEEINVAGLERFMQRTNKPKKPVLSKEHHYKNCFCLEYDNEGKLTIGYSFNGKPSESIEDEKKGFIEFNPNKLHSETFWKDFYAILNYVGYIRLKRWDLAMDIKAERSNLWLKKDMRKYYYFNRNSKEITEYMGCRNNPGFVRFYNKQIEAGLTTPLVRLELTCGGDWELADLKKRIPKVLGVSLAEVDLDSLSESHAWYLRTLTTHEHKEARFNELSYHLKKTLTPYLDAQIEFDSEAITYLMQVACQWNKGETW